MPKLITALLLLCASPALNAEFLAEGFYEVHSREDSFPVDETLDQPATPGCLDAVPLLPATLSDTATPPLDCAVRLSPISPRYQPVSARDTGTALTVLTTRTQGILQLPPGVECRAR